MVDILNGIWIDGWQAAREHANHLAYEKGVASYEKEMKELLSLESVIVENKVLLTHHATVFSACMNAYARAAIHRGDDEGKQALPHNLSTALAERLDVFVNENAQRSAQDCASKSKVIMDIVREQILQGLFSPPNGNYDAFIVGRTHAMEKLAGEARGPGREEAIKRMNDEFIALSNQLLATNEALDEADKAKIEAHERAIAAELEAQVKSRALHDAKERYGKYLHSIWYTLS
jgi:hypothetical protein